MISEVQERAYENLYETVLPLCAGGLALPPGELVTESQLGSDLDRLEFSGNVRLIGFAKRGN